MLQNAVGDFTELTYVKQINDQDVEQGNQPLVYEYYMDLLLSACSTYDEKTTHPGLQKHAVYASAIFDGGDDYPMLVIRMKSMRAFQADTDINDMHATNTSRFGQLKEADSGKPKQSNFLPPEEVNKLTQDQKDVLIAKRRQERMGHVSHLVKSKIWSTSMTSLSIRR
jgi:hypothetical protein